MVDSGFLEPWYKPSGLRHLYVVCFKNEYPVEKAKLAANSRCTLTFLDHNHSGIFVPAKLTVGKHQVVLICQDVLDVVFIQLSYDK